LRSASPLCLLGRIALRGQPRDHQQHHDRDYEDEHEGQGASPSHPPQKVNPSPNQLQGKAEHKEKEAKTSILGVF
jgi:hypothetical protein